MSVEITDRRDLNLDRAGDWRVVVFDGGARYILACNSGGLAFSVHFDATEWDKFQEMVSP